MGIPVSFWRLRQGGKKPVLNAGTESGPGRGCCQMLWTLLFPDFYRKNPVPEKRQSGTQTSSFQWAIFIFVFYAPKTNDHALSRMWYFIKKGSFSPAQRTISPIKLKTKFFSKFVKIFKIDQYLKQNLNKRYFEKQPDNINIYHIDVRLSRLSTPRGQ